MYHDQSFFAFILQKHHTVKKMSAIFCTIVVLRVLLVVARPNCRIANCNEVISNVNTENRTIEPSMRKIRHHRSQRISGFGKHRKLVFPRHKTNRKQKYPIRIKISRKYLKKHSKYPKAELIVSRNLRAARYLKKDRLRRHRKFYGR